MCGMFHHFRHAVFLFVRRLKLMSILVHKLLKKADPMFRAVRTRCSVQHESKGSDALVGKCRFDALL